MATVVILHPGEMGSALAACLRGRGHRVLWVPAGRSAATRGRARQAGLEESASLGDALAASDVALSVCPPHGARGLAREVAGQGFRGLFVDANAVSPAGALEMAAAVEAAGARYVDGGIVGPPPVQPGRTRLYLSGSAAREAADLFAQTNAEAIVLGGGRAAASAMKACYAAWTKGAGALFLAIRALARHEGVEQALQDEWSRSQPEQSRRAEWAAGNARKAWRWIGEMEEIAASFEAAGLPAGFHHAALDVYRALESFRDGGSAPSLDEVLAAVLQACRAPADAR